MSIPYLIKTTTGRYLYRRAVPPALRDSVGQREIKKALGKDQVAAMKRYAQVHREAERILKSASSAPPLSERDMVLRGLKQAGLSPKEIGQIALGRGWGTGADGIWYEMVDEYEQAERDGVKPKVALEVIMAVGAQKLPPQTYTISSALDHYRSIKETGVDARDKALANRVRHLKERLIEVIGKSEVTQRPLERFSREEARRFRDYLAAQVAPNSVRRILEILSPAISKTIDEYDLQMKNPVLRLEVKGAGASRSQRKPLTEEDLKELAEVMVRKPSPSAVRSGKTDALGAIWVTLRDTGARLGEICNLRVMDVDLNQGCIHIRPYGDHTLKSKNSERKVPLSPGALQMLGVVIGDRKDDAPIFPKYAGPRKAEKASAALIKRLRTKISDGKKVVHSLRHRMKDRLRDTNCPESLAREIMGHSEQGVAFNYGQGYSLDLKREALVKVW